jgi:hypothetical protein
MASIEDIDYLWENSDKQSFLLYIDSSKRNRFVFPNPNQYVVEFNNPFRFVYGYDILDALIPTTMYNVEPGGDTLVVAQAMSTRNNWLNNPLDLAIFDEFRYVPEFAERCVDGTAGSFTIVTQDSLDTVGMLTELVQTPDADVRILVTRSVGISDTQDSLNDTLVGTVSGTNWYASSASLGNALDGPVVYRNIKPDSLTMDVASARFVTQIDLATILQSTLYDIMIIVNVFTLPTMNYDNRQLLSAMNNIMQDAGYIASHFSQIPEQANKYSWTGTWPFWFNMEASTIRGMFGFDELALLENYEKTYNVFPQNIDPTRRMYLSYYDTATQFHTLNSPNMIDLGGPAYVVFRVPELEEHAFAGEGNNADTVKGLGIFKLLSGGGGMQNLRFDFTNLVRKPFHPIGKLSRLTIRLELKSGALYDFKGINHNILLVIKYLIPQIKSKVPRYTIGMLNSDYVPDTQQYMLTHRRLLDESREDVAEENELAIQPMPAPVPEPEPSSVLAIRDLVSKYLFPSSRD